MLGVVNFLHLLINFIRCIESDIKLCSVNLYAIDKSAHGNGSDMLQ